MLTSRNTNTIIYILWVSVFQKKSSLEKEFKTGFEKIGLRKAGKSTQKKKTKTGIIQ